MAVRPAVPSELLLTRRPGSARRWLSMPRQWSAAGHDTYILDRGGAKETIIGTKNRRLSQMVTSRALIDIAENERGQSSLSDVRSRHGTENGPTLLGGRTSSGLFRTKNSGCCNLAQLPIYRPANRSWEPPPPVQTSADRGEHLTPARRCLKNCTWPKAWKPLPRVSARARWSVAGDTQWLCIPAFDFAGCCQRPRLRRSGGG